MAGIFPECGICNNIYEEIERKPLMLLCGHTYCQQCLQSLVSGGSPACPSCMKEIVSQITELPVNFMLIPSSSSGEGASRSVINRELFCDSHQDMFDFWCVQCKTLICKQCLVQEHSNHKFTLTNEVFADKEVLTDIQGQIGAKLQQTVSSLDTLCQLESLSLKMENMRPFSLHKKSLQKQHLTLTEYSKILKKTSSEPSLKEKSVVLNILKHKNQTPNEINASDALKQVSDLVSQYLVSDKPLEYMPDGREWPINNNELAEEALCTMKETDHHASKAIVRSTDEAPILCLPELLQYLAASSTSMELQLMDTAGTKYPDEKDWFPLKAGGEKSKNFNHCYRLKVLANTLMHFHTWAAVRTSFGRVESDSSQNKLIALLHPETRTSDICVLAFGKVVRENGHPWPLPLEIHVIGMAPQNLPWVKYALPILYSLAQPNEGEWRVYLPQYNYGLPGRDLFSMFAEIGKRFSAKHRMYIPRLESDHCGIFDSARSYGIQVEYKNF